MTEQEEDQYIAQLQAKEGILYRLARLARLARNTDGIYPTTWGRMVGDLLVELRNVDAATYHNKVIAALPSKENQ